MTTWLGLDVGTSALKALVVDDHGSVVDEATVGYGLADPEADPDQDPGRFRDALAAVVAACPAAKGVSGIAIVGQTPTLVFVDDVGAPVRPALAWFDVRAADEAAELAAEFGDPSELMGIGLPWAPGYPPAKLLWLRRIDPGSVARTRWILQPKDYLGLLLTGTAASDLWCSKGMRSLASGEPVHAVLDRVGWPAEVVPPVLEPWRPLGAVTAAAARAFGLPASTTVATGWSDALAGMLAMGAFVEPTSFLLTGTSDIVGMSSAAGLAPAPGLLHIPASCAPLEVLYGPTQSSGASLTWLSRLVGLGVEELLASASAVDDGPVFVPYLNGERSPVWRSDVSATILGLRAEHGIPELARAVLRGAALSGRDVLETVVAAVGREPDAVHASGAGVAGDWGAMRADLLGCPLVRHRSPNPSALGAAMLAAAAATGRDLSIVARELSGDMETITPRADERAAWQTYRDAARIALDWADRPSPGGSSR